MKVYLYDDKGAYTEDYTCQANPLVADAFIIPISSLSIAPVFSQGLWPVAVNSAWTYVEDHLGETVYSTTDGYPEVWEELGGLPSDVTTKPRPNSNYLWDGADWVFSIDLWRQSANCTAYQFRAALNELSKRQQVETAVTDSTSQDLKDAWEYGTTYDRLSPYVLDMQAALGSTDDEVDAIFELAVTK